MTQFPSITNARLPQSYERAKEALSRCSAIDECKDWADKTAALASYARQAKDDGLRLLAERIQARAIRRLLKQFDARPENAKHQSNGNGTLISQREAAHGAGLSKRQQVTAVRVANVREEDFESAIESENPPTITALADLGKKTRPLVDLEGRDPMEFTISTHGQGHLHYLAEFAKRTDAQPGEDTDF
jgi:hypothetical protein